MASQKEMSPLANTSGSPKKNGITTSLQERMQKFQDAAAALSPSQPKKPPAVSGATATGGKSIQQRIRERERAQQAQRDEQQRLAEEQIQQTKNQMLALRQTLKSTQSKQQQVIDSLWQASSSDFSVDVAPHVARRRSTMDTQENEADLEVLELSNSSSLSSATSQEKMEPADSTAITTATSPLTQKEGVTVHLKRYEKELMEANANNSGHSLSSFGDESHSSDSDNSNNSSSSSEETLSLGEQLSLAGGSGEEKKEIDTVAESSAVSRQGRPPSIHTANETTNATAPRRRSTHSQTETDNTSMHNAAVPRRRSTQSQSETVDKSSTQNAAVPKRRSTQSEQSQTTRTQTNAPLPRRRSTMQDAETNPCNMDNTMNNSQRGRPPLRRGDDPASSSFNAKSPPRNVLRRRSSSPVFDDANGKVSKNVAADTTDLESGTQNIGQTPSVLEQEKDSLRSLQQSQYEQENLFQETMELIQQESAEVPEDDASKHRRLLQSKPSPLDNLRKPSHSSRNQLPPPPPPRQSTDHARRRESLLDMHTMPCYDDDEEGEDDDFLGRRRAQNGQDVLHLSSSWTDLFSSSKASINHAPISIPRRRGSLSESDEDILQFESDETDKDLQQEARPNTTVPKRPQQAELLHLSGSLSDIFVHDDEEEEDPIASATQFHNNMASWASHRSADNAGHDNANKSKSGERLHHSWTSSSLDPNAASTFQQFSDSAGTFSSFVLELSQSSDDLSKVLSRFQDQYNKKEGSSSSRGKPAFRWDRQRGDLSSSSHHGTTHTRGSRHGPNPIRDLRKSQRDKRGQKDNLKRDDSLQEHHRHHKKKNGETNAEAKSSEITSGDCSESEKPRTHHRRRQHRRASLSDHLEKSADSDQHNTNIDTSASSSMDINEAAGKSSAAPRSSKRRSRRLPRRERRSRPGRTRSRSLSDLAGRAKEHSNRQHRSIKSRDFADSNDDSKISHYKDLVGDLVQKERDYKGEGLVAPRTAGNKKGSNNMPSGSRNIRPTYNWANARSRRRASYDWMHHNQRNESAVEKMIALSGQDFQISNANHEEKAPKRGNLQRKRSSSLTNLIIVVDKNWSMENEDPDYDWEAYAHNSDPIMTSDSVLHYTGMTQNDTAGLTDHPQKDHQIRRELNSNAQRPSFSSRSSRSTDVAAKKPIRRFTEQHESALDISHRSLSRSSHHNQGSLKNSKVSQESKGEKASLPPKKANRRGSLQAYLSSSSGQKSVEKIEKMFDWTNALNKGTTSGPSDNSTYGNVKVDSNEMLDGSGVVDAAAEGTRNDAIEEEPNRRRSLEDFIESSDVPASKDKETHSSSEADGALLEKRASLKDYIQGSETSEGNRKERLSDSGEYPSVATARGSFCENQPIHNASEKTVEISKEDESESPNINRDVIQATTTLNLDGWDRAAGVIDGKAHCESDVNLEIILQDRTELDTKESKGEKPGSDGSGYAQTTSSENEEKSSPEMKRSNHDETDKKGNNHETKGSRREHRSFSDHKKASIHSRKGSSHQRQSSGNTGVNGSKHDKKGSEHKKTSNHERRDIGRHSRAKAKEEVSSRGRRTRRVLQRTRSRSLEGFFHENRNDPTVEFNKSRRDRDSTLNESSKDTIPKPPRGRHKGKAPTRRRSRSRSLTDMDAMREKAGTKFSDVSNVTGEHRRKKNEQRRRPKKTSQDRLGTSLHDFNGGADRRRRTLQRQRSNSLSDISASDLDISDRRHRTTSKASENDHNMRKSGRPRPQRHRSRSLTDMARGRGTMTSYDWKKHSESTTSMMSNSSRPIRDRRSLLVRTKSQSLSDLFGKKSRGHSSSSDLDYSAAESRSSSRGTAAYDWNKHQQAAGASTASENSRGAPVDRRSLLVRTQSQSLSDLFGDKSRGHSSFSNLSSGSETSLIYNWSNAAYERRQSRSKQQPSSAASPGMERRIRGSPAMDRRLRASPAMDRRTTRGGTRRGGRKPNRAPGNLDEDGDNKMMDWQEESYSPVNDSKNMDRRRVLSRQRSSSLNDLMVNMRPMIQTAIEESPLENSDRSKMSLDASERSQVSLEAAAAAANASASDLSKLIISSAATMDSSRSHSTNEDMMATMTTTTATATTSTTTTTCSSPTSEMLAQQPAGDATAENGSAKLAG